MPIRSIPPSVTYPSPNEWPQTQRQITGITRANLAKVTSPNHGFTSADVGVTSVDFLQVKGMIQINSLMGLVQQVIDNNNFTVNINSTQFSAYSSGGTFNIVTGTPPSETIGFQTFNTPFHNVFTTN